MHRGEDEASRSPRSAAAAWVAGRWRWERWLEELERGGDGGTSLPVRHVDLRRVA